MKINTIKRNLDFVIYWAIVLIPFSIAIAPAFPHSFIGIMSVAYLLKKALLKEKPFIKTPVSLPFYLMLLAALLSFCNSIAVGNSAHGIGKMLLNFLTFIICAEEIKDRKHMIRIMISVFAGAILMSADALWQLKFGYDFVHGNQLQDAIGLIRATASFPNPNVLGVYLSAITPLVIGLSLYYFKGKIKLAGLIISALITLGIASTLSRGTALGFYFAVLFISICRKNKAVVTLLLLFLLIFPFVMPSKIKNWAQKINYNPVVFMLNADRISIYNNSLNMIKHHPIFGVGINTFAINYFHYKLPEKPGAETSPSMYAHNNFLQMAAEVGLFGLFMFLWFLFALFKQGHFVSKALQDDFYKIVAISLMGCFISFLVNGLTETSLYYSRVAMIFWYLIGLSLALKKFSDVR